MAWVIGMESGGSLPGWTALLKFAVVVVVAAVVAVALRVRPRRIRRPQVGRGRRGVVHRNDWISRILLGVGLAGLVVIVFALRDAGSVVDTLYVIPFVILGYLLGVSHRVVVTPTELAVFTAVNVTRIPRSLVTGFAPDSDGSVAVHLEGHAPVKVGVGVNSIYDHETGGVDRRAAQQWTIASLDAMMTDFPEEPNAGQPSVKRRWVAILVVLAAFVGFTYAGVESLVN